MDRISEDSSVRLNFGDESVLINRVFDNIHIFDWLGHSILKIVDNDSGFMQWHMPQEQGLWIAEEALITPVYRPEITQREYDGYLRYMETRVDDSWLE